jgi:hypothetical protein
MMLKKVSAAVLHGALVVLIPVSLGAQNLKTGFDAREYLDLLSIAFGNYDSFSKTTKDTPLYRWQYRSRVTGLDNRWNLWLRRDAKVAVISVRGTVGTATSWLANFYATMQPATGTIRLNDTTNFTYKLSDHPEAKVHTGWLISLGFLSTDIERKIRDLYKAGVRQFLITGHSQGGGIAYLLRSYLYYRTKEGALPPDIRYKTYCSAAPKPGNLYYAYDYEFINRDGWAFNVVNVADWVPETPVSIQQFGDMNPLNPFTEAKGILKSQNVPVRIFGHIIYGKLDRATRKAARKYRQVLGRGIGKQVVKRKKGLSRPEDEASLNYMRAGTFVVLMPDEGYYQKFTNDPSTPKGVFTHHTFEAYAYLLLKDYPRENQ